MPAVVLHHPFLKRSEIRPRLQTTSVAVCLAYGEAGRVTKFSVCSSGEDCLCLRFEQCVQFTVRLPQQYNAHSFSASVNIRDGGRGGGWAIRPN